MKPEERPRELARLGIREEEVAWRYLLPGERHRRWREHIAINDFHSARRTIDIDLNLPDGRNTQRWFMPVAYFAKHPLSPVLAITDAAGDAISTPTSSTQKALTHEAIEAILRTPEFQVEKVDAEDLQLLISDIVHGDLVTAYLAHRELEPALKEAPLKELSRLLGLLTDHYMLWVPIYGEPNSGHHIRIVRNERFDRQQIVKRRRAEKVRTVCLRGETRGAKIWPRRGAYRISLDTIAKRLLLGLGYSPIDLTTGLLNAHRYESVHMRAHAPGGFVVRHVGEKPRVGVDDYDRWPEGEEGGVGKDHSIQGIGNEAASVYYGPGRESDGSTGGAEDSTGSGDDDPTKESFSAVFGVRDGLTSLWAIAAIFASALLWLTLNQAPFDKPGTGLVGVLLVTPSLAAAWVIRQESELEARTVVGARMLLLATAALAAASALALEDIVPFGLGQMGAVELYATMAYVFSATMAVGWAVGHPVTWSAYHKFLGSIRRNALVALALVFSLLTVAAHGDLPEGLSGGAIAASGLGLAVIALNPLWGRIVLDEGRNNAERMAGQDAVRLTAGSAAMVALLAAGSYFSFNDEMSVASAGVAVGMPISVICGAGLYVVNVRRYRGKMCDRGFRRRIARVKGNVRFRPRPVQIVEDRAELEEGS